MAKKNLHTVSQVLEVNDFTRCLTSDENWAFMQKLTPFPLLRYKLWLLVRVSLINGPTVDKFLCQVTSAFLFQKGKNVNQIFKK